jgi:hypothetical protein
MSLFSALAPVGVFLSSTAFLFGTFDITVFDEDPNYVDRFTQKDHASFDRSFDYYNTTCDVGIERKKICFKPSPLEAHIEIGQKMPTHAPVMPATIPVILRTELKPSEFTTHRYGRTLVLIEDASGMIVDRLDLLAGYSEQERRPTPVQYANFQRPTVTTEE